MSESRAPIDIRQKAGLLGGLIRQVRLAWRLLTDGRVPTPVKLIPLLGLAYLLSPIDLLPDLMLPGLGELDDVGIILLALKAFVDLSPQSVVREHLDKLVGTQAKANAGSTIDAPYRIHEPDQE